MKTTGSSAGTPAAKALPIAWQIAAVLLIGVCGLWHLHTMNRKMAPQKADLVPVWIGAQIALHGGNPYSDETTRKIQAAYYGRPLTPTDLRIANKMAFAYPAHTLVLLSFIAPLPWMTVRTAFLILLPLLTAASVPLWLWTASIRVGPGRLALLMILAVESWPSMWGIHQIQPTLLVAALVAAGCFLLTRGNGVAAGTLLAMATIKPQLAGVLIVWLLLWAVLRRRWSFLLSFLVTFSVLMAAATWLVPGWLPSWRAAMADYAGYRQLRLDLVALFGHWLGGLLSAAIGLYSIFLLWLHRRCPEGSASFGQMCALALAMTVCLSPNEPGMIYNQVLLLPAVLLLIHSRPLGSIAAHARDFALLMLGWGFLTVALSALGEAVWHPSDALYAIPFFNMLLPASVVIALQFLAASPEATVLRSNVWKDAARVAPEKSRSSAEIPSVAPGS